LDIEERVYPLDKPASQIVEEILQHDSDITPAPGDDILQARPNSYTFSKSVAENLVREKFPNLPVVICRPSIVTHSVKDPVEGWCDSMNGLAGTLLLGALGIARTMQSKSQSISVHFRIVIISLLITFTCTFTCR